MERDQNDTIIAPFQGSNESFPGMTLPVAINGSSSGTTTLIPQPLSNIPSYVQPRQPYLEDKRRSSSPIRVKNIQQLVASTLSSNQLSRLSNLRVTTPSVGNTNNGLLLGNPYNFF
ncbi:13085_t:CDS:2 [Funneliformis caledonium]|uniref:13085_t:CDS:1 n=1 Tax=Funneliformis caledonium TaxID=1117310 RepID=A0A9N8V8B9_9GLOM|nr:13085_t:CDS:2 [Funneliformis caledonium]